jgi:hypothetical protein
MIIKVRIKLQSILMATNRMGVSVSGLFGLLVFQFFFVNHYATVIFKYFPPEITPIINNYDFQ